MEEQTLMTFSEYVYGIITLKRTNKPDTKIFCGDNNTKMTVTSGDTLVYVDETKGIISESVAEFDWDWNGSRGDISDKIKMKEPMFIGKK